MNTCLRTAITRKFAFVISLPRSTVNTDRSLQWGNEQFGPEKDTYERPYRKTFRKPEYHKLSHGYGVMRDSTVQLQSTQNSINNPMSAAFVAIPGPRTETGQPIHYLAFVQCDREDLVRDIYLVGESGTFCFEQPEQGFQPTGWQYVIKPPIGNYEYPGNLVMQITRERGDSRVIPVEPLPEPRMATIQIRAFPQASDLSPRRLINCANLITSLGDDADDLRRYVCALDIHENDSNHGLFDKIDEYPAVNELLKTLSPSQLGAFNYVKDIKHPIALIQGPPGTGKTTFIVTLLQILSTLGHAWIACAPSNSATDHMATVLQTKCPELGAIRFHSFDNEARAIRKQERDLVDRSDNAHSQEKEDSEAPVKPESIDQEEQASATPVEPESIGQEEQDSATTVKPESIRQEKEDSKASVKPASEDKDGDEAIDEATPQEQLKFTDEALNRRLFDSYIADLQTKDVEWKGKMGRPNFKDMGLNIRALQNAGVIEHDIPCFAPTAADPHAEFREALKNRDFGKDKTDEEKSRYKDMEEVLMIDTLRKTCGVVTTLSKAADNKLKKARKPVVAVVDEACQSTELETLLVWAHNTETLVLIIFIGDPKHLPGTVKTLMHNTADSLVNPFVRQMIISLFERL